MAVTFPGESSEYRAARDRLLAGEIELRRAMESVAAARRELPPGGPVPTDSLFQGAGPDGTPTDVRLSELFAQGKDSLVLYSFMFPRDPGDQSPGLTSGETAKLPLAEGPCPSCTALIDQLHQVGSTIVVITHDHAIAARMPRKIEIVDGQIVSGARSVGQAPS